MLIKPLLIFSRNLTHIRYFKQAVFKIIAFKFCLCYFVSRKADNYVIFSRYLLGAIRRQQIVSSEKYLSVVDNCALY